MPLIPMFSTTNRMFRLTFTTVMITVVISISFFFSSSWKSGIIYSVRRCAGAPMAREKRYSMVG